MEELILSWQKSSSQSTTSSLSARLMTHGNNKRNFQIFSPMEFIAAITQHIPEPYFQLTRFSGTDHITPTVEEFLRESGIQEGLVLVNAKHIVTGKVNTLRKTAS